MRCPDCGQPNPEGSRFCNHCGARFPSGVAPLAEDLGGGETTVFVLRPALILVLIRYGFSALLMLVVAATYWYFDRQYPDRLPWWVTLVAAVILLAPALYRHILRQREVYTLTNHKIEFTYGLIAKVRRNIPLRNVQDVTVTRTIAERLLGIGDIVIDSASREGRIPLRNIRDPEKYADLILRQIRGYQR